MMDDTEPDEVRRALEARLGALHGRLSAMTRPPERGESRYAMNGPPGPARG